MSNHKHKDNDDAGKGGFPLIRLLPNIVTIMGLCLGLFALKYAMMAQWQTAVMLIIIAAFVDGIDGRLARMLNASSNFGAQLDSFTDFVNFGVAPALTLYLWKGHEIKGLGWAVALFFIISMALRLARFNVGLSEEHENHVNEEVRDKFFQGLPAPCGGAVSLIPMILTFLFDEKFGYQLFDITAPMVIVYMVVLAIFMVSRIPTISVKKVKIPREYASLFMAAAALFIISLIIEPWVTLPLLGLSYLATVPFSVFQYLSLMREFGKRK
jgi:CDP-diacylglycerol--serine O-phosphatidyltransferase